MVASAGRGSYISALDNEVEALATYLREGQYPGCMVWPVTCDATTAADKLARMGWKRLIDNDGDPFWVPPR